MKAAAGEEFEDEKTSRPVAFDPNSIWPTPQELMQIDPNAELPAAKKKELIEKYGHASLVDWREANWGVVYVFSREAICNVSTDWSLLRNQTGSVNEIPFAKDVSGRRLAEYPEKVWCAEYWSQHRPPYGLLEYIGRTWDIKLENFYDTDELLYCGVQGSQGRDGKTIEGLVDGNDGYNGRISYSKDGVDPFDMEYGDLLPENWKQIDEIKKVIQGSFYYDQVENAKDSIKDPERFPPGYTDQWLDCESRKERSLKKARKIIEAAIESASAQLKSKLTKAETQKQVKRIKEVLTIGDPDGAWELVQKLDNPCIFEELLNDCVRDPVLGDSSKKGVRTPANWLEWSSRHGEFFIKLLVHLPKEAQVKPEIKEITELGLQYENITEVTLLAQLQHLTVLILSNNQIADVSPLESLSRLEYLDLRQNVAITRAQVDELIEAFGSTCYIEHDIELTSAEAEQVIEAAIREEIDNPDKPGIKAYLHRSGLIYGPYSEESIRGFLGSGLVNSKDLACICGSKKWVRLGDLLDSAGYLTLGKVETLAFKADETIALRSLPKLPQLRGVKIECPKCDYFFENGNYNEAYFNPRHVASDLRELTQIVELDLMYIDLPDLSFLKEMKQLRKLHLQLFDFEGLNVSVSPVAELLQLEELRLTSYMVTDLSFLEKLTKLTSLTLGNNMITDLSPLAKLKKLKNLSLFDHDEMDGSDNLISDISPLRELKQIEDLNLSCCQIGDLSTMIDTLRELTQLRYLYLGFNQISDLSPLDSLKQLKYLNLQGNGVTEAQIDELRKALPKCEIYG